MADRVTKTPTLRPGHYAAKIAKALEDEAKARSCSHYKDAASGEPKSSGSSLMEPKSHNGGKFPHLSDRETELVFLLPERVNESTPRTNRRPSKQAKQAPFVILSKRAKRLEGGRLWERKAAKRLLKRELAGDIEILKSEMENLRQMVISLQPLLHERSRGKRVTFRDEIS